MACERAVFVPNKHKYTYEQCAKLLVCRQTSHFDAFKGADVYCVVANQENEPRCLYQSDAAF